MLGRHCGGGGSRCRAATPTSSTSSRASSAATSSSAATAVPPGTACQHCSRVTATRTALHAQAFAKCRDRALEPFPQRNRRLPVEKTACERQVRPALRGVVDGQWLVHDLGARTGQLEDHLRQFEHGEFAVVADVDRPDCIAVEECEETPDLVLDVAEAAGLRAVA